MIDETRGSVWFVTGSQHLYGEETLRQVHEHSRKLAEALNDSPAIPVAIVDREPLTDADAIRRVLAEASSDDECVGVIVWMHTFSPARMWIGGLNALRKPLLHLHTQFDRELPWGQIDMDYMNLNQSAHGDREFAYIETRMGVSRKTVVGHWSDRLVQERIGTWIRAACGWQEAQRLRIARFGDNMRDVAVTEGDKVGAQITLGATVNGYGVDGLSDAVEHARDAAVDELLERYDDEYDLASELRSDGARRESLRQAAQIEVGLRSVLLDGGFGAFTDTFEDLGRLRQLPGIAVQRLMAEGYGFGGEGDWKTALLLRVLKVMASGLSGGTSFMEDYVYHLGPGPAKVLGAHMLEICPSIAAARPSCEIHPLSIGGRDDPVRLVFTAPPGQAVMVCLVDVGGRLRLVANQVDVVAARRGAAAAAGGPGRVGAPTGALDGGRGVAHGGGLASQRVHDVAEDGGPARPGRHRRDRAAGHRRGHHHPAVRQRAALESRLPPPGARAVATRSAPDRTARAGPASGTYRSPLRDITPSAGAPRWPRILAVATWNERSGAPGGLTRGKQGRWLGGVCVGLAAVTGRWVGWIRAAFAVGALVGGLGIALYLACWLIIPAQGEGDERAGSSGVVVMAQACAACAALWSSPGSGRRRRCSGSAGSWWAWRASSWSGCSRAGRDLGRHGRCSRSRHSRSPHSRWPPTACASPRRPAPPPWRRPTPARSRGGSTAAG